MIVIKNVFGGSQVFIKNVFANAENIVVVYNGGDPIEITGGGGGTGDVVGPASATDNAIARFNLTTGKLIQNSGATIDDSGNITANNLSGTNTGDQDLSGKANTVHTHAISDTTGLQTELDGKAASSHTHAQSDITNLVTDLAGKAASSHTHAISDVTGLQTALDGKAASLGADDNYVTDAEKVKLSNLSGTNTGDQDLSGKANVSHTHAAIDITDYYTNDGDKIMSSLGSAVKYVSFGLSRHDISTNTAPGDATEYLVPVFIKKEETITGVKFYQAAQGNYTADATNEIGLYTYNTSTGDLTLVATTGNNGNIWKGTANSEQTAAFSTPYSASVGLHYIGILYNNSAQTTAPQLGVFPNFSHANVSSSGFSNSAKLSGYRQTRTQLDTSLNMSNLTTHNIKWALFLY